jgi:Fuc2NAc and GlcNAc transferase
MAWLLLAGTAVLSWALTRGALRYAQAFEVIDVPNARSSHVAATPTGGGIAIAASLFVSLGIAAYCDLVSHELAIALIGGGAAVAVIGWLDDHTGVRARVRLVVHFAAAAWALLWMGGIDGLSLGVAYLPLAPLANLLAAVGIVWAINFYNFMDGIDGIAGGEALIVGLAGAAILLARGNAGMALAPALTAAGALGFLAWNWPPARIFMGDIGSGVLGFVFGALSVASERSGTMPLLAWVILLGVFVFDATVTLMRRMRRGHRLHDGHRHHAYQRSVISGMSHRAVTSSVLALNVALAGLAAAGTLRPRLLPWSLLAAVVLLGSVYRVVGRRMPMADEPRSPARAP